MAEVEPKPRLITDRDECECVNIRFTAAPHQVAGHLFEYGKCGSLICEDGFFYKPLQDGQRGERERSFYENLSNRLRTGSDCSVSGNEEDYEDETRTTYQPLASFVPRFFGVLNMQGVTYVKLEDFAGEYRYPCVMDVKVGFRTWYHSADEKHIEKCKKKDAATTTSSLGFKICGLQVYSKKRGCYWKASKHWCKTLDEVTVREALFEFVNHSGLHPKDVYTGPKGILAQIEGLEQWFEQQRLLKFYSSSLLILYEGNASCPEEIKPTVKLIDFAHSLPAGGKKDKNFLSGLISLKNALGLI